MSGNGAATIPSPTKGLRKENSQSLPVEPRVFLSCPQSKDPLWGEDFASNDISFRRPASQSLCVVNSNSSADNVLMDV